MMNAGSRAECHEGDHPGSHGDDVKRWIARLGLRCYAESMANIAAVAAAPGGAMTCLRRQAQHMLGEYGGRDGSSFGAQWGNDSLLMMIMSQCWTCLGLSAR